MNRYTLTTPRVTLGAMAVAMAALNFAVLIVLPAQAGFAPADLQVAVAAEPSLPHTDSGRAALATADVRGRRHDIIARLVANVQDAGLMRLAGPLTTSRSDR